MSRFSWVEYIYLARRMMGWSAPAASQEALWRAAISRAYYAAFVTARNYVRDVEGVSFVSVDAHRAVSEYFTNSAIPARQGVGETLRTLRLGRNRADYEDYIPRLRSLARRSIERAEAVIAAIGRL